MIINYPVFKYSNPYGYMNNRYNYPQTTFSNNQFNKNNFSNIKQSYNKETNNRELKKESNKENIESRKIDEECFEIFGIKLYFDDILIIGLLFFLYNEGVQDQYLFICLILLLLS